MVKRYLTVTSLADATRLFDTAFSCTPSRDRVPLIDAVGRVTAEPIFARYSVPEVHLAAMDGIAVVSSETGDASEQHPVTLGNAVRVNTGNVVPQEYDAVIMIEDVHITGEQYMIRKAVPPWQHVRPAGEDIGESEMALPSCHRIRPHEIGALAAYGITDVSVLSVKIGLIPTGSELVPHGTHPAPGQVVESNTVMAEAVLRGLGASCTRYPMVKDDPAIIRSAIEKAVRENDVVVISAGSSAGTRDYTAEVIADLGQVLVHGVAIKPGKPVIIGKVSDKPVIGMPGYPLSALTVLREIITPLIRRFGLRVPADEYIEARLTSTIHKDVGSDEFVLCSIGRIGDRWVISPQSRGAGVQMSAVRANAFLKVPSGIEGFEAGEQVTGTLTVPRADAVRALLITGSHDPVIDYLTDLLQKKETEIHSTHVGSMGGILALKKNECHAAPMHLLADNGDYNVPFLEKYLPGEGVVLLCVAERQQGIVSKDGLSFEDIPNHRFINRQRGSGTRMLLDHELRKRAIDPATIPGYDREVTTHLAVALAVKSGEAEAGMCVFSAAKALGLEFVPVASERYELAIRREHLDDPRVAALCATISSPAFKAILDRLGGYGPGDRREARTALRTASSGDVQGITPGISHVFKPNTGIPALRAIAISARVPWLPPIEITDSADWTTRTFLAWPRPVRMTTSRYSLPSLVSGTMPTVIPFFSFAPRQAASITPPSPPHTTVPRFPAIRPPVTSAVSYSSIVQSPAPITAICMIAPFTAMLKKDCGGSPRNIHGQAGILTSD